MAGPRSTTRFEDTVLPHLDAAHNLARWLVRDATLAQDVVQDAILRALGYFQSYRGGDARAWLLQIVRNTAYTALEARNKPRTSSLDTPELTTAHDIPDPAPGPEATFARRQDKVHLAQALATLPIELRECLVLRELEECSYKEIGQITGVPIGTVMSRLWRARQLLMRGQTGGDRI